MASHKAVLGLVSNSAEAEGVIATLQQSGFAAGDVSVLFPDMRGTKDFAHERSTKAPEGAVAGVGAGGVIGGTLGLLAGLGALTIPSVGPFLAAGPIMAALSCAAAGAAVGGVAGALVGMGMGIPEFEAKQYEGKILGGNIPISIHVEDRGERARAKEVLRRHGGTDIVTVGEEPVPSTSALHA